jgi:hypothetical protein
MGFRDDPGSIRSVRERLYRLGEELKRDPGELEIGTTLDVKPSAPAESESPAEAVVESLGQLKEAGVSFCALSLSPMTQESLAWVIEDVAPNFP